MIDPTKPMWLSDGTPLEYVSTGTYHVKLNIPAKYWPHPARRHQGSNSHEVWAHVNSDVLTHNHAYTVTNKDPNIMIDITKPLEAVRKSDGKVVPVTFNSMDSFDKDQFRTNEIPDPASTNSTWYLNGTDRCHQKAWTIRNVAGNVTRVRYAIPGGTPAYLTVEEASAVFFKFCTPGSTQAKVFRHEQEDISGVWTTIKVDVLDVIQPSVIKVFDMAMKPISYARSTESYVQVELIGGIVVKLEIVHPS